MLEPTMGSVSPLRKRTSLSMPQANTGDPKVATRNVQNVVLGNILFTTWYPSFYPEELVGKETDCLYVCQWCFKYSNDPKLFLAHSVGFNLPLASVTPSLIVSAFLGRMRCQTRRSSREDNVQGAPFLYLQD